MARSIIGTIWTVNDKSTSQIMDLFYKYLAKGQSKSNALRKAKLEFISTCAPEYRHPYYWAGFIAVGDMDPIFSKSSTMLYVLLGGVFLIVMISMEDCHRHW